ncbi:MAG: hemerythrin domain-containing protein [Cyanobacteriota bacterium]
MENQIFNSLKSEITHEEILLTFISEHEFIIKVLNNLNLLNKKFQKLEIYENALNEIELLKKEIDILITFESHHQREEKVLFFSMEEKGIIHPTKVMRWEHHEIRQYTNDIKFFLDNINNENFILKKRDINFAIEQLVLDLEEHIYKENNILYSMAVNLFFDKKEWEKMKYECDKIGYPKYI